MLNLLTPPHLHLLLQGTSLCSLTEDTRIPKFFRVTDQDAPHFPPRTFSSLHLSSATPLPPHTLNITFTIQVAISRTLNINSSSQPVLQPPHPQLDFYYNEYDWGIIYRQIGLEGGRSNDMFYKTAANLRDHAAAHPDWSPRQEENRCPPLILQSPSASIRSSPIPPIKQSFPP